MTFELFEHLTEGGIMDSKLDYTRGARVARRDFRVENVQKTVAGDVNLTLRERINL